MSVYKAINAVQSDLCKQGISKDSTNTFDNYKFRGIDAIYNALSPLLAKHGLCILPRIMHREVVEHTSQKGGILFYVTVDAEFDFVCAEDGSKHTVKTFGEAMDRGDKATNKAMSAAYKYAAFQTFAIPTEGDNDADASSHVPTKSVPVSVWDTMPEAKQRELQGIVDSVRACMEADKMDDACVTWSEITDADEKTAGWSRFASGERSALKAHAAKMKKLMEDSQNVK